MGAIGAVMAYGSEAQKRLAADLVLAGDKPAICITEPEAGSAATEMTTRADAPAATRYVINGRKHWITGGGVSRLHLIFARVFDERRRARHRRLHRGARRDPAGLMIQRAIRPMGLRGMPEAEIHFEDLEVPTPWCWRARRAACAAASPA